MGIPLCTRESVKAAVEVKNSAAANRQIDRIIGDVGQSLVDTCHREFAPWIGTRYVDLDPADISCGIWLREFELISLTSLAVDGTPISPVDVVLHPSSGPPFTWIETKRSTPWTFSLLAPTQPVAAVGGTFGYTDEDEQVTTLAEALDDSETSVDVADGSTVGVGSLLRIDDEWIRVVDRIQLDLGVTLGQDLTERNNATALTLSATTANMQPGEQLLVDAERMQVENVAGTTCVVKRGVDGSVLAAHTAGAAVYSPRTLTVRRGQQGSAAVAHAAGGPVFAWVTPAPVNGLAIAESIVQLERENSGYVRIIGSGDGQAEARGGDLIDKRKQVFRKYRRRVTFGAA
jgi:hypothetical protein